MSIFSCQFLYHHQQGRRKHQSPPQVPQDQKVSLNRWVETQKTF